MSNRFGSLFTGIGGMDLGLREGGMGDSVLCGVRPLLHRRAGEALASRAAVW
jgi:site-specific DNA-cytosine methylase